MSDIVQALKDGCPTRPSGDGIGWEYNIEAADMIMERASEELTRLRSLNAELVTALDEIAELLSYGIHTPRHDNALQIARAALARAGETA